jgi:hypothetical protein
VKPTFGFLTTDRTDDTDFLNQRFRPSAIRLSSFVTGRTPSKKSQRDLIIQPSVAVTQERLRRVTNRDLILR